MCTICPIRRQDGWGDHRVTRDCDGVAYVANTDFEDIYIATYKFTSIGTVVSSPVLEMGVVYFRSMDGNAYALWYETVPFWNG